ncbi:hypothetical protein GQ600_5294 [Phytophthora cactorum]|nr:hypothetical protein GQ600_5294 [Phytophthora cactorum]
MVEEMDDNNSVESEVKAEEEVERAQEVRRDHEAPLAEVHSTQEIKQEHGQRNSANEAAPFEPIIDQEERGRGHDRSDSATTRPLHSNAAKQAVRGEHVGEAEEEDRSTKKPMQQFMYKYLESATIPKKADTGDVDPEPTQAPMLVSQTTATTAKGRADRHSTWETDGYLITGERKGSDDGLPLKEWLKLVDGQVTDVPATGQCGWIAFHAAWHNITEGLIPVSSEVAEAANALKKQVLNGMIANVADEKKIHPTDFIADVRLAGKEQDVLKDDTVRMQGYAYKDIPLDADHTVETGTVQAIPTDAGQLLIKDLVKEGTLPLMLVLRHLTSGNHYQAVTYPKEKFGEYARNWKDLTSKRNAVIITFGGCSLDPIPYDAQKTAQAAAQQLKKMRSATKLVRQSAKGGATVEEPRRWPTTRQGHPRTRKRRR